MNIITAKIVTNNNIYLMQEILDRISETIQLFPGLVLQIVETLGVIVILWALRLFILRLVKKNTTSKRSQYKWAKNLTYVCFFIGALLIGQIWFSFIGQLGTYLGLLSAGIAIALREPVASMAAWMYVIGRKPFDIGDRIQIGELKGDVIDISVFQFTLLEIGNWVDAEQSTGRVVHIPNHKVFSNNVANYTSNFEFIWQEISFVITYESNWKKAKAILQQTVDEVMKDFVEHARQQIKKTEKSHLIHYEYLTPIVYTGKKDNGISLSLRYLVHPRKGRGTNQQIWELIFDKFASEDDIQFAYPTIRYYDRNAEGGSGFTDKRD